MAGRKNKRMIVLSKRAREEWIRGLTIGIICCLVAGVIAIGVSSWNLTSKTFGIFSALLLAYICYNEYDKRLLYTKKARPK
jgi:putative Ca2+/H+ antiporter (TMEM165/GDT1 family)